MPRNKKEKMKIDVSQKKVSFNYEYEISKDGVHCYTAQAGRVIWPFFRKIVIRNTSGEEIASLAQRSMLLKLAEKISLFGCPYVVSQQGRNLGWIREWPKWWQPHSSALFQNNNYMIYGHSGYKYSLYRDSLQIESIKKELWKEWDGDKFHAEFDYDSDILINVIHLLFIDISWHTADLELWSNSYETNITFGGVKEDPD